MPNMGNTSAPTETYARVRQTLHASSRDIPPRSHDRMTKRDQDGQPQRSFQPFPIDVFSTAAVVGVVLVGLLGAHAFGPGGAAIGIIIGDIGGGVFHNFRHRTPDTVHGDFVAKN